MQLTRNQGSTLRHSVLLNEWEEKYARREANGTDLAIILAALGEDDEAIGWTSSLAILSS